MSQSVHISEHSGRGTTAATNLHAPPTGEYVLTSTSGRLGWRQWPETRVLVPVETPPKAVLEPTLVNTATATKVFAFENIQALFEGPLTLVIVPEARLVAETATATLHIAFINGTLRGGDFYIEGLIPEGMRPFAPISIVVSGFVGDVKTWCHVALGVDGSLDVYPGPAATRDAWKVGSQVALDGFSMNFVLAMKK